MGVVLVTGGPGSPGITTTALGLCLAWPGPGMLVDCDRDPSQAIPAGYLRGVSLGGTGLPAVALAHRQQSELGPLLRGLALELDEDRQFLPGFSRPEAVAGFESAWLDLARGLEWLTARGAIVVIDAGRVGAAGPPDPLVGVASAVVFVVRSSLRSLAAARLYLPLVQDALERHPAAKLWLALVGPGRPYVAHEVETEFQLPVLTLPWQPKQAAVLSDGDPVPRSFRRQALMRAMAALGSRLRNGVNSMAPSEEDDVQHH